MKKCERCGTPPKGFELLDYCGKCGRDLCERCMQAGCCGVRPAVSGMRADFGEDEEEVTDAP